MFFHTTRSALPNAVLALFILIYQCLSGIREVSMVITHYINMAVGVKGAFTLCDGIIYEWFSVLYTYFLVF